MRDYMQIWAIDFTLSMKDVYEDFHTTFRYAGVLQLQSIQKSLHVQSNNAILGS